MADTASAEYDMQEAVRELTASGMPLKQEEAVARVRFHQFAQSVASKEDVNNLRSDLRDQRSDIRDQSSDIRDLRSVIQDQRSETQDLRSDFQEQRSEIRILGEKVDQLDKRMDQADKRMDQIDKKIDDSELRAEKRFEQLKETFRLEIDKAFAAMDAKNERMTNRIYALVVAVGGLIIASQQLL